MTEDLILTDVAFLPATAETQVVRDAFGTKNHFYGGQLGLSVRQAVVVDGRVFAQGLLPFGDAGFGRGQFVLLSPGGGQMRHRGNAQGRE